MATEAPVTAPLDRRQRRRQETIEEVLDIAVEIMSEQGVGGLSVGEVARRMGIRPPSLYVYFESKHALYDALFARGARLVLAELDRATEEIFASEAESLEDCLLAFGEVFCRWAIEHPAYTQLLFWRPVPGFEPSPDAYAPAVQLVEMGRERFAELQRRGLIRADATLDEVQRDWTILTSGVISQQLSNAPNEPFDSGTFTTALPRITAMFAAHYSPPSRSRRRTRHADQG